MQVNNRAIPYRCLRAVYRLAPFDLKGDWRSQEVNVKKGFFSCLIIASVRPRILEDILWDLASQTMPKDLFEVVVLNDGAGENVRAVVKKYEPLLNIRYAENKVPHRVLSNLRNATLQMAQGEYVLLLDDDTRILQKDFLTKALEFFQKLDADILMPHAHALYGIVKARYDFLDPYSFANRCCLYRRRVLEELGGFNRNLNTYEDIELSIRIMIKTFRIFKVEELGYFHPPLYFDSMRKPLSIGQTVFQMQPHYSWLVWLAAYLNALRFLPYGLSPNRQHRQWFKISWGVLLFPFTKKSYYY